MNAYSDIMRCEKYRTADYGASVEDGFSAACPCCGSNEWDFLMRDCHGDIIGCEDCVTKIYPDEIADDLTVSMFDDAEI